MWNWKGYKIFSGAWIYIDAMDGPLELCRAASEYTGITIKHMRFHDPNKEEISGKTWQRKVKKL